MKYNFTDRVKSIELRINLNIYECHNKRCCVVCENSEQSQPPNWLLGICTFHCLSRLIKKHDICYIESPIEEEAKRRSILIKSLTTIVTL